MKKLAVFFILFGLSHVLCADSEKNEIQGAKTKSPVFEKRKLTPAKISSSYSRLCLKADLVGFWRVVKWTPYFHIPAKDWNKPLYLKNQWYMFFDNGSFSTMSAKKDKKNKEVKSQLLKVKTALRYKFVAKGLVEMFHAKKETLREIWRCALVTDELEKGVSDAKVEKGDILMSLLDSTNTVMYVRHMRKVK